MFVKKLLERNTKSWKDNIDRNYRIIVNMARD